MHLVRKVCAVGLGLAVTWSGARATEPTPDHGWKTQQPCPPVKVHPCPPPQYPSVTPAQPGAPGTPTTDPSTSQQPAVQPPSDAFAQGAQTPEAGPGDGGSYNPQMFGDLVGYIGTKVVTGPNGVTRSVKVPIGSSGSYKISENESPRPVDRVFFSYNFYDNVFPSLNPGFPGLNLHRELLGFEKTFLDGNASVGVRLPWFQLTGASDVEDSSIGDLTVVTKYAFVNDRCTGDVLSAGFCVTVPTGEDFVDAFGETLLNTTFLQPWAGFIANLNQSLFVVGFTAVIVPVDNDVPTLLTNDLAVGFWLRRGDRCALINSIAPVCEVHVTNPLNHRGSQNLPVGFPDIVDMTYGVHVFTNAGWGISAAVGHPLTGPKPFDLECIVQLTYRF